MPRLNPGDPFPKLTLSTTDGQPTTVPDAFACDWRKHGLAFTVVSDAGNGLTGPCAGEVSGSPVPALEASRPAAVSSARRG
jgi:hypothetical protein